MAKGKNKIKKDKKKPKKNMNGKKGKVEKEMKYE